MLWISQNPITSDRWNNSHFFQDQIPIHWRPYFRCFLEFFFHIFLLFVFFLFFVVSPGSYSFLQVEEQKEAFDVLDSDGNGKITFQEVKAADSVPESTRRVGGFGSLPIRKHGCVCVFFEGRGNHWHHPQSALQTCRCCGDIGKFV